MVCVVRMRERQQGAGQWACSCSIYRLEARAWTERMRDDGEGRVMESEVAGVRGKGGGKRKERVQRERDRRSLSKTEGEGEEGRRRRKKRK